jgi:2-haloacid dehalogenase
LVIFATLLLKQSLAKNRTILVYTILIIVRKYYSGGKQQATSNKQQSMAIRNIIFDFGGVLIDWNPRLYYKNVFPDETEMDYFLTEICNAQWCMKIDGGYSFAQATKDLQVQYPEYHSHIELYLQNWELMIGGEIFKNTSLLNPLKEKYRLFGLTNWSAEAFPIVFEQYQFFKNFEGIIVSGFEKMVKPNKEIFELLLDRYKLAADESLFIDDNLNNITTAKEIGFSTIHINGDKSLEDQLMDLGLI